MSECGCGVCCSRRRQGLPALEGVSAFRDVHLTDAELPARGENGSQAAAVPRVVERPAPYPPAAFVRGLEDAIAQIVAHVEKRLDRLELELSLERRMSALEARAGGPISDAEAKFERGEPLIEREWRELCARLQAPLRLGIWAPAHSTWRGGR